MKNDCKNFFFKVIYFSNNCRISQSYNNNHDNTFCSLCRIAHNRCILHTHLKILLNFEKKITWNFWKRKSSNTVWMQIHPINYFIQIETTSDDFNQQKSQQSPYWSTENERGTHFGYARKKFIAISLATNGQRFYFQRALWVVLSFFIQTLHSNDKWLLLLILCCVHRKSVFCALLHITYNIQCI